MKANSIDRVVVSNTNPHNNNALWIDTSNGEKNAVLKYKGNHLVGGCGGTTSGIPTIDKNIQPNIVWREPTAEDLAKFHSSSIGRVADLPNGQVPICIIANEEEEPGVELCVAHIVTTIVYPQDGMDGGVWLGDIAFVLSGDWSLLGIRKNV